MKWFLLAHTNAKGRGIAQAAIPADTRENAHLLFSVLYPLRVVTATGIKGEESEDA